MPTSRWIRFSFDLELLAELQVERSKRLVEQQDLGQVDERAGKRHTLLLTAESWFGCGWPPIQAPPARAPRPRVP